VKADLTLYYNAITVNSIKMTLLCHAMDIQPNFEHVVLHKADEKSTLFLKLNPQGRVPVLVDGSMVLSESNAILQYLAHKYRSPLWPSEFSTQAETLKWLFWLSGNWNQTLGAFAHRRVILPHWGFGDHQALSQGHMDSFHGLMGQIDQHLNDKPFLVGEDITIADISLGSYLMFTEEAQIPLESYGNVSRWHTLISDTNWWQKTRQALAVSLGHSTHKQATV